MGGFPIWLQDGATTAPASCLYSKQVEGVIVDTSHPGPFMKNAKALLEAFYSSPRPLLLSSWPEMFSTISNSFKGVEKENLVFTAFTETKDKQVGSRCWVGWPPGSPASAHILKTKDAVTNQIVLLHLRC